MPGPKSNLFLWESLDVLGCNTILGVFYGIAFTLYCLCAQSLYPQLHKPDQRRQAGFTLGCISLLLICATSWFALNARTIQLAYINHADFLGGPLAFELEFSSTAVSLGFQVMSLT